MSVVPASDFLPGPEGAPASQAGVAQAPAGMPTAQDFPVPTVDPGVPQTAAPAETPPPIDVEQITPEIRAYLEQQFRSGYVPATDLDALKSTKDQELHQVSSSLELERIKAETAAAQLDHAKRAFAQYVTDVSTGKRQPHPNDAAGFILGMQSAGQQVAYSRGAAASQLREWESAHEAGLEAKIDQLAAGGNGLPTFERGVLANDPELKRLDQELRSAARDDAKELYRNPAHGQRAVSIHQQMLARMEHLASMARVQAVAQPQLQQIQQVQGALDRQQQRGVQTAAPLGSGSLTGAWNDEAAWQQARTSVASQNGVTPDQAEAFHYDAVYAAWKVAYDAANRR